MDLSLPVPALAWQRRAKAFAEEHLFPLEVELEMAGRLPPETLDRLRRAVREHGLNGINHAKDVGGQGCTQLEQTLINEELGKATGALWAVVSHPAVPLKHGTASRSRRTSGRAVSGAAGLRRHHRARRRLRSAHDPQPAPIAATDASSSTARNGS